MAALKKLTQVKKMFPFSSQTLALGFRIGVSKITPSAMGGGPRPGSSLKHTPIVMYGQHQSCKRGNEDSSASGHCEAR